MSALGPLSLLDATKISFTTQTHTISVTQEIFPNPLKNIDGSTVPVTNNTHIINVDSSGNPNQNGGFLKILNITTPTGTRSVTWTTTSNPVPLLAKFAGTLTVNHNFSIPVVTLDSGVLQTITNNNLSNYTISGTCSVINSPVTIVVGTAPHAITTNANCLTGETFSAQIDVTNIPDGNIVINASQTSNSQTGNATPVTIQKDTTPPTATITASTTNPTNQDVTLTLTANEPIQAPADWTEVPGSNGTQFTRVISANENVSVSITDTAGNTQTSPIVLNVTNIDKDKPTITGVTSHSFTVGSTEATGFDALSGITASDTADAHVQNNLNCTTTPAYNGNTTGTYTVTCNVTDAAGNIADTFTRTITITGVDKAPLQSAITAATSAINNPAVINDTQKQQLQDKITEAQTAINNPNLTETQRNTLIAELQDAINALNTDTTSPVFT